MRIRIGNSAFALAIGLTLLAGHPLSSPVRAQSGLPTPDHVVLIIEENHTYEQIIGNAQAPYINTLAAYGALFTNSHAITNPSQPNYLALFSGSTQGIRDDSCPHTFSTPNLGAALLDGGYTFAGYSETMPSTGYTGCSSGSYRRKHNPWVNWQGISIPASANLPFTQFPSDYTQLPTVSIVVPNQRNDMHDGTIAEGDAWLQNNLDPYVQWAFDNNSLLVFTFDEGNAANNRIATILVGPMVAPGLYDERINHYSVLRTIEDMYGLPYAGESANVDPIVDVWW